MYIKHFSWNLGSNPGEAMSSLAKDFLQLSARLFNSVAAPLEPKRNQHGGALSTYGSEKEPTISCSSIIPANQIFNLYYFVIILKYEPVLIWAFKVS